MTFATVHVLGQAYKDSVNEDVIKGLKDHFNGECGEVGMYLAMARQADREGYPEIAEAYKRYAYEEADHASRFAELLGEVLGDTKSNLEARIAAEKGACEDKFRIAKLAKEQGSECYPRHRSRDGKRRGSPRSRICRSLQEILQVKKAEMRPFSSRQHTRESFLCKGFSFFCLGYK